MLKRKIKLREILNEHQVKLHLACGHTRVINCKSQPLGPKSVCHKCEQFLKHDTTTEIKP